MGRVLSSLAAVTLVLAACGPAERPRTTPRLSREDLAESFPKHASRLQAYVALETHAGEERRAFPLLQGALAELGLTSTVTPAGETRGNVFARLSAPNPEPGARPLVLLHHIDVVPVEREAWTVDPFAGEIRDGRLYGRGVIDIKHLGIVQLAALERLAKARDRLRRDVIFLAVSDEEVEGRGAQAVVEHQLEAWNPEYLLDEGGFAVRRFFNERDLVVIATTQKRLTRLRLTAHGEAGHGSRPLPNGGPTLLVEALARLAASPPPVRLIETTRKQFAGLGTLTAFPKRTLLQQLDFPGVLWGLEGRLTENKNLNPSLRDTIALTMISAGQKDNVIPAEASATLDVRLLPDTDAEVFLARVRGLLEGLPVTAELLFPPLPAMPEAPTDDPLYHAIEDTVRAHEPQAAVAPWLCVGATDSRFFAPRGVKTYGFSGVFLDKEQLDTIHGNDENLTLEALERGIVLYSEALERFLLR